jgi:hypothetical protein
MAETYLFRELAELLRSGAAKPIVSPDRVAPSTIYDSTYRIAILACAFQMHAKPDVLNTPRVHTTKLKLLQFVAIRPWLAPAVAEWAQAGGDTQLSMLATQRGRRGFLGDTMYDRTVEYLVARQILVQTRNHLSLGPRGETLKDISTAVEKDSLFVSEREALAKMTGIRITNEMLEGW